MSGRSAGRDILVGQVLQSLHQHRLLTCPQLRVMHAPGKSERWTQMVTADLRARGLADRTWSRTRPPVGVWYLTLAGLRAVAPADRRPPGGPELASGPLLAHTLAVNEVGICFLCAARALGHECGPFDWVHESAHRLGDGRPGTPSGLVVADAVLQYVVREGGQEVHLTRFIELDRATMSVQDVVAKLRSYVRLFNQRPRIPGTVGGRDWRERYRSFPPILVVLAGGDRAALERRRRSISALASSERDLGDPDRRPAMALTLLEDLQEPGPFGPVFVELGAPDRPVDLLGRSVEGAGRGLEGAGAGGDR